MELLRQHLDDERDRERDAFNERMERFDQALDRLEGLPVKLENHEERLTAVEAAVAANTAHRSRLTIWLDAFRYAGPYVWTVGAAGMAGVVGATLWAVRNGYLTP